MTVSAEFIPSYIISRMKKPRLRGSHHLHALSPLVASARQQLVGVLKVEFRSPNNKPSSLSTSFINHFYFEHLSHGSTYPDTREVRERDRQVLLSQCIHSGGTRHTVSINKVAELHQMILFLKSLKHVMFPFFCFRGVKCRCLCGFSDKPHVLSLILCFMLKHQPQGKMHIVCCWIHT